MKNLIVFITTINLAFSINGKITFYDGTSIDGELSSSDTEFVFLIPDGLVMPEKIPVEDIESLKLDNGIILIEDGFAKQIYSNEKFSIVQKDDIVKELDSNNDFIDYDLGNLNYFNLSLFYGIPVYFRPSLLDNDKTPTSLPNIGLSFSLPYFPVGPFNMSAGGKILTVGFDTNHGTTLEPKKIKSITLAATLASDLQPILSFLPDNIHIGTESGITYSLGWQEDYAGGLGIIVGSTLDYWFEDLPIYLRLFGNGIMIPSAIEGVMTGFGNIGLAIGLVLKRD